MWSWVDLTQGTLEEAEFIGSGGGDYGVEYDVAKRCIDVNVTK